jgi:hypothetical protein
MMDGSSATGTVTDPAAIVAAAQAAQAQAEAEKAQLEARQLEQQIKDHDSPAAAQQRNAEAKAKVAQADKDAADARRAQLAALIPDLSKVTDSTLDVKEAAPLWSTFLVGRAVALAGRAVAAKVRGDGARRILITSDTDLASADAIYADVKAGLDQLASAAVNILRTTAPPVPVKEGEPEEKLLPALPLGVDAAGAVAGAIPAVLSLLSAHRTVTTAAATATDLSTVAAVAGALMAQEQPTDKVTHDDFRLVPIGAIYRQVEVVSNQRQTLVARKIELDDAKSDLEAKLTTSKDALDELQKIKTKPPNYEQQVAEADKKIAGLQEDLSRMQLREGLVDSLLTAIDAFMTTVRTSAGSSRSPLAAAALHEPLHDQNGFTHVLLVKAQPGEAQELIDKQPLWIRDKYSTAVDIAITYMLIEIASSTVVVAGTETATCSAHGKIGEDLTLNVRDISPKD